MRKARRALAILSGCVLALLAFFSWWILFLEPGRLVVRETALALPGWPRDVPPLRIAVLSDVHAGSPHIDRAKLRQIVTVVNATRPDAIALLGDYVIQRVVGGRFMPPSQIADGLSGLSSRYGTFAVMGNHDWWYDGEEVSRELSRVGIRTLENASAPIRTGRETVWIAGLAEFWTRRIDLDAALAGVPAGHPVLLLVHNPDVFPEVPARFTLTLAGHTHGGQVFLPLLGRPVIASRYGERYALGHIVEGGRHLFVTTGIGTSILPVRFRVPPEIVVLTLGG